MNAQQLADAIFNSYQFSDGLNKSIFRCDKLPKSINVLAASDNSMLFKHNGRKQYAFMSHLNVLTIERA